MFNFLGQFTSLPLANPVVGLPPFNLWTDIFCSNSSADEAKVFLFYKDSSDSGVTGVLNGRSIFKSQLTGFHET